MASHTDCAEEAATLTLSDEDVSMSKPILQDVDDRLVTLSEKINICKKILNDLKALSDVLVRKPLRDLSLPPQS